MAIQKSKTLTNGTTGNYWKITKMIIDKSSMLVTCRVELFVNASFSNKKSIGTVKIFKVPVTKEQMATDVTAICYASIKAQANATRLDSKTKTQIVKDADLAGGTDV